jgi:hypothetical protein
MYLPLTLWDLRLRHIYLSLFTCRMENMNFDDLSLLLGVIEIWMVPNILVHGLQFSVL